MRRSLNPLPFMFAGFDWHGRTGRGGFAIALCLMICGIGLYWGTRFGGLFPGWVETVGLAMSALWFVPFNGHLIRRLNDLGWSGWIWWLGLVPYLGLLVTACLLVLPRGGRSKFGSAASGLRSIGFVGLVILSIVLLSRVFWHPYAIPSGSMKPNLVPGDYLIALRGSGRIARGDVVVFALPVNGFDFIMRVIGLPGDKVQLRDGIVLINGQTAKVEDGGIWSEVMEQQGTNGLFPRCSNGAVGPGAICQKRLWIETLPDGTSQPILDIEKSQSDTTSIFDVPEGMLFVLGDNRDNSTDSRFAQAAGGVGFVPLSSVRDRAWFVAFSSRSGVWWQVWTWAPDRFLLGVK